VPIIYAMSNTLSRSRERGAEPPPSGLGERSRGVGERVENGGMPGELPTK